MNTRDTSGEHDILRVVELLNVATQTEGVDPKVLCFIAARILRKENMNIQICSQMIACRDHMDRQPVSHEVYVSINTCLIDEFGVYQNASQLAMDRVKRWDMVKAQAYGPVHVYPLNEDKEDEEIYAGWGYTSSDIAAMVDKLEIEDCANRIHLATSVAGGASISKNRL